MDFGESFHNNSRRGSVRTLINKKVLAIIPNQLKNYSLKQVLVPNLKKWSSKFKLCVVCVRENVNTSVLQGATGFRPSRGDARWRQRRRLLRRLPSSSIETAQGWTLRDPRSGLRGKLDQIQRYNMLGVLYTTVRFVVVGYRECVCVCYTYRRTRNNNTWLNYTIISEQSSKQKYVTNLIAIPNKFYWY